MVWRSKVALSRQNKRLVALRVGAEICATIAFLTALKHMPLANVTAILQALPLAVTMAAALFLAEPVGWRRWSAIIIGFMGVLIVIGLVLRASTSIHCRRLLQWLSSPCARSPPAVDQRCPLAHRGSLDSDGITLSRR